MSGETRPLVVVNPRAAGGRTESTWRALAPRVDAALRGADVEMTRCVGDGRRLAAEAARRGCELVVAVGGDGTVSEVADGLIAARNGDAREHDAALGIVPCGTGSDFVRGLGLPGDPRAAVESLERRRTRRVDVGRVRFVGHDGAEATRHFVNGASLGFTATVAARVNGSRRRWGRLAYAAVGIPAMLRSPCVDVRLRADGDDLASGPVLTAALGNGSCVGGGMTVFQGARADDGLLRLVVVRAGSPLRRLLLVPALYRPPRTLPRGVSVSDVSRFECLPAAGSGPVAIEVDGETPGRLPATFDVLPLALSVVC